MNRIALTAAVVASALGCGCYGAVIEPGHRGLMFEPKNGGLQREVLQPGYHKFDSCFLRSVCDRIDDFDVTYSTRKERLDVYSKEGLPAQITIAVTYRPIVAELYELDTEFGQQYYDEVVGPEARSAARDVFSKSSALDFARSMSTVEDGVEAALRRRLKSAHVEIATVTVETLKYPPDVAAKIDLWLVDHANENPASPSPSP